MVDDVTGLIRHFGEREAAVVGHDWGAGVAWAVAQRHPEYVWKLAALQVPPTAVWAKNITLKTAFKSWYMFFFQLPRMPEWLFSRNDFAGARKDVQRQLRAPGTFSDGDITISRTPCANRAR